MTDDTKEKAIENEARIEELKQRVGRVQEDLKDHREDFEDYKEKQRDDERETKWNKWQVGALIVSGIVGAVISILGQTFIN